MKYEKSNIWTKSNSDLKQRPENEKKKKEKTMTGKRKKMKPERKLGQAHNSPGTRRDA
jgi:hypothetical protein